MKIKITFMTITVVLFLASWAFAQAICPIDGSSIKPKEVRSFQIFKRIAVLDNGRVKPIDTYAANCLLQLSGKKSFQRKPAIVWFARLIFAPDSTRDDKIFLINNPAIANALKIKPNEKRLYAFSEIEPSFEKLEELAQAATQIDSKKRDIVENELIRVYENVKLYSSLSLSFAFAFPHEDFGIQNEKNMKLLALPENMNEFSFFDIAVRADRLQQLMQPLAMMAPEQWSEDQKEIIQLTSNLFQWSMAYHHLPLSIIPSYSPQEEEWFSPWDAMTTAFQIPQGRKELTSLRDMMMAYWNGEQLSFDLAAKSFNDSIETRLPENKLRLVRKIGLETLYNQINLFFWAKLFYFLTFIVCLISLAQSSPKLYRLGWLLLILGFICHAVSLVLRITILERPPVSNLYETFIFVGFISALAGIIIERVHKHSLGLVISSLGGFIFLLIASKFAAEGDTLQMLVAVLNSNFWLGTHVLSITTGYAGVCVAGIVGHIYILQSIFRSKDKKLLDSTYGILIGTLGFGLTMAFLGTNLGGIWADQSWGRFWGWDPKENGALLIILWTALLFHLRVGNMIGRLGLAVGSVLGIIVVMWAWFGVNLLSIGLHSYGFTHGLATNLAIYVICQLSFILIAVPLARRSTMVS